MIGNIVHMMYVTCGIQCMIYQRFISPQSVSSSGQLQELREDKERMNAHNSHHYQHCCPGLWHLQDFLCFLWFQCLLLDSSSKLFPLGSLQREKPFVHRKSFGTEIHSSILLHLLWFISKLFLLPSLTVPAYKGRHSAKSTLFCIPHNYNHFAGLPHMSHLSLLDTETVLDSSWRS